MRGKKVLMLDFGASTLECSGVLEHYLPIELDFSVIGIRDD